MRPIRQKCKSRSGASMLLALLFLLICAVVGSVILTAATTNAGRVERIRSEQQAYLNVKSAATFLRDDLFKLTFVGRWQEKWGYYYAYETKSDPETGKPYQAVVRKEIEPVQSDATDRTPHPDPLYETLRNDIDAVYHYHNTHIYPGDTTLWVDPQELTLQIKGFADISARVQVNEDYSITVTLSGPNGENPVTLMMQPSIQNSEDTTVKTTTSSDGLERTEYTTFHTTSITWTGGDIAKGAK